MRSEPEAARRAYNVINDPAREFVASDALSLELLPNAIYFDNRLEQQICNTYFQSVTNWVNLSRALFDEAFDYACAHGLGAMDALHLAAALSAGASELITTEKPTKPLYRNKDIRVTYLLTAQTL
jgi:hypothetical protein